MKIGAGMTDDGLFRLFTRPSNLILRIKETKLLNFK